MLLSSDYATIRAANSNRVDLEDGFYIQNLSASGGYYRWEMCKEGERNRVGFLITYFNPEFYPTEATKFGHQIADIGVDSRWRGQGMGEKMVKAFVQLKGGLTSDPTGNTSKAAMRMWERLGAEKIPISKSKNSNGFFYVLRK